MYCTVCYTIGHYCQIALFHPQKEDPAGPAVSSGVFSAQLWWWWWWWIVWSFQHNLHPHREQFTDQFLLKPRGICGMRRQWELPVDAVHTMKRIGAPFLDTE